MSSLSTGSTAQGSHVSRKELRRAQKKAHKVDMATKEARDAAAARAEERAIQRLGIPPSPRASVKRQAQLGAAELAEKLSGSASERETVYGVLSSFTADDREFAVGFVAPLATVGVQSADVVSPEEYRRSALALAHLIALDTAAVGAEWLKDEKCLASYRASGNALDAALSKGSDEEMTHDDAMTAAAAQCCFAAAVVGSDFEPLFAAAEVEAEDWMGGLVVHNPYRQVVAPGDARNVRLSTLLLELLHDDAVDAVKLPKGLAPGVWNLLSNLACTRPAVGLHQAETGMLSLAVAELRRAPSLDWSGANGHLFLAVFWALGVIRGPGAQMFAQTSGLLEILLVMLDLYTSMRSPEPAAKYAVYYAVSALAAGRFFTAGEAAVDLLRGAVSSVTYLLNHPIVVSEELGLSSNFQASLLVADVFGRVCTQAIPTHPPDSRGHL